MQAHPLGSTGLLLFMHLKMVWIGNVAQVGPLSSNMPIPTCMVCNMVSLVPRLHDSPGNKASTGIYNRYQNKSKCMGCMCWCH